MDERGPPTDGRRDHDCGDDISAVESAHARDDDQRPEDQGESAEGPDRGIAEDRKSPVAISRAAESIGTVGQSVLVKPAAQDYQQADPENRCDDPAERRLGDVDDPAGHGAENRPDEGKPRGRRTDLRRLAGQADRHDRQEGDGETKRAHAREQ